MTTIGYSAKRNEGRGASVTDTMDKARPAGKAPPMPFRLACPQGPLSSSMGPPNFFPLMPVRILAAIL